MTPTLERDAPFARPARDRSRVRTAGCARGAASSPATVVVLAERRTARRILDAARDLFAVAEYGSVDFAAVAQAAGVRPAEVGRRFASRMELTLATLELPPAGPAPLSGRLDGAGTVRGRLDGAGTVRGRLDGAGTVRRFLSFWETGANTAILTGVLRAAMRDARIRREVEDVLATALVVPLAAGLGTTDAGPRARLVTSALIGLAVTRYLLTEEPLASADHETLAAWMGPSIDCYLRGALGV